MFEYFYLQAQSQVHSPKYRSTLWGPTCDSFDRLPEEYMLPELYVGDRLKFTNMGAYSTTLSTNFNGMPTPQIVYVMDDGAKEILQ